MCPVKIGHFAFIVFPLIHPSNVISINGLSLVVNITCQFDIKHNMAISIKQECQM
jgi:hypothetical protein